MYTAVEERDRWVSVGDGVIANMATVMAKRSKLDYEATIDLSLLLWLLCVVEVPHTWRIVLCNAQCVCARAGIVRLLPVVCLSVPESDCTG